MLEEFNKLRSGNAEARLGSLVTIVQACRNAGSDPQASKSFDYAFGRFVKGLQSQVAATRQEFYTGLVALLRLASKIQTEVVVDSVDKVLSGSGGDTKSEKRLRAMATIMAYGAVIRARFLLNEDFSAAAATKILRNLVNAVEKKKALVSLASPFVTHLLSVHPVGAISDDILSCVRSFLHKPEGATYDVDQVKLILTAEKRGLTPSLGSIETVEELGSALKSADPNDKEFLSLVFEHVRKKRWDEEFWNTFMSLLGPYDFDLFCTCICESLKSGCSFKTLITEDIVKLGLSVFHNRDLGKEAKDHALEAFTAMLAWDEKNCDLTPKEKKKALKILYKKTPNLLFEYPVLRGVIRAHLQYLTEKDVVYLAGFVMESLSSEAGRKSLRGELSSLALLCQISQLKQSTAELCCDIAKLFFQLGYCKPRNEETKGEDVGLENLQQQASSHFKTTLEDTTDAEFVRSLLDYVKLLVDDSDEIHQLRTPLTDEIRALWKRGNKFIKKTENDVVRFITTVGAVQLVADGTNVASLYEEWLDVAKKAKNEDGAPFVIPFIIDQVVGSDRPFFNYEGIFKRFAVEGKVSEEAIQSLADAIEPGDDFGDDDDEEDEDVDDDDMEVESADENDEEGEKITNGGQPNGELFTTPSAMKASLQNGDGSDSEATIDMDEATEEDLKKMDEALAAVFAAKKRARDESRLEGVRYMRVLTLVDLLLSRYKEPPISAVLILLMPLVSSVKHNLNDKSKEKTLERTLKTLKRLNKFKKFSGTEEVETDVLSTMAEEIQDIVKKKNVPKPVKDALSASMKNLLGVGKSSAEEENDHEVKMSKKQRKKKPKQNKNEENETTSLGLSNNSHGDDNQLSSPEGKSKKKQKKKKQQQREAEEGISEKRPSLAKRKAQSALEKKKAKHMRLQVLSEGLSNFT